MRKTCTYDYSQEVINEIKTAFYMDGEVLRTNFSVYEKYLVHAKIPICGKFTSVARIKFIVQNGYSPNHRIGKGIALPRNPKIPDAVRDLPKYIYRNKNEVNLICQMRKGGKTYYSPCFKTVEDAIAYLPILKEIVAKVV